MEPNEDVKEQMRKALEAKKNNARSNNPHETGQGKGKGPEHSDREGGKRNFRRKSG